MAPNPDLSKSVANTMSQPACLKPKEHPPAPANRLIALGILPDRLIDRMKRTEMLDAIVAEE